MKKMPWDIGPPWVRGGLFALFIPSLHIFLASLVGFLTVLGQGKDVLGDIALAISLPFLFPFAVITKILQDCLPLSMGHVGNAVLGILATYLVYFLFGSLVGGIMGFLKKTYLKLKGTFHFS